MKRLLTGIGLVCLWRGSACILVAGEVRVVYGHHHLNTTSMDAQEVLRRQSRAAWRRSVRVTGAGDHQVPECSESLPPDAGSRAARLDRRLTTSAFPFPISRPVVAKIKANGFKMMTAIRMCERGGYTTSAAASHDEPRICARSGGCKGRAGRSQNPEGPDSASSHPLLRARTRDEGGAINPKELRCDDPPGL